MSFVRALEAIVRDHPNAVALLKEGARALTYAELYGSAARLARAMLAARRDRERPLRVGLAIEKSPEYVVALVATWLAGGAFTPLDPELPAARLALILNEIEPDVCIASPLGRGRILACGAAEATPVLGVDASPPDDIRALPEAADPEALAYILYTSGSSGRPKGVMVEHTGLVPMLRAQIEAFELRPGSRSLWMLQTAFDASISDIGTALLAGATLLIEPPVTLAPTPALLELMRERGVTYVDLPVRYLSWLDPDALPACLETVVIGGEAAPPEVVRAWSRKVTLINVYGPTEATICTSLVRCTPTWSEPDIGTPIAEMRYQRVDGELWIAGPGLARGYLNRPGLTAERFVVDDAGARWYRTRDAITRQDERWIFARRIDRQFKLRGQLVEPGEVEAALTALPEVEAAAVLPRLLPSGERVVAAFVSAREPLSMPALREALAATLPRYMLPERVVEMGALPRSESGKVDLGALERWPLPDAPSDVEVREPVTERERLFCAILNDHLGFSIHLGHSLVGVGATSLDALSLAVALEAAGFTGLSPAQIVTASSFAALLGGGDAPSWMEGEVLPASRLREDVAGEVAKMRTRPVERGREGGPQRWGGVCLVTGASGFFGARLLMALRERRGGDGRYALLVRARSPEHGLSRVARALSRHGVREPEAWLSGVRVVPGDLAEPGLGLSDADSAWLEASLGCVVHVAARVHMLSSYQELREPNLVGTRRVFELAEAAGASVHMISTLSVFVASDRNRGVARESDTLEHTRLLYGGYGASKWAAEVLARARSAATIHRLGLITGDSETGVSAPDDFLRLFVRGLRALGAIPELPPELALDMTPVDEAARAVATLIGRGARGTFHIANPESVSVRALIDAMCAVGVFGDGGPERLGLEAWLARARAYRGEPACAAALVALCRALGEVGFERHRSLDLFQATDVRFDATRALAWTEAPSRPTPERVQRWIGRILADEDTR